MASDNENWFHAAGAGNLAEIERLLDCGASVNAARSSGQTALHVASHRGHSEIVRMLLSKGADYKAVDSGILTALHHASYNNHSEIVDMLLYKGADHKAVDSGGKTALHLASQHGHSDTVSLLLRRFAGTSAVDSNGDTPLMLAACHGKLHTVNLLLRDRWYFNTNHMNKSGKTAVMLAKEGGFTEVVELIENPGRGEQLRSRMSDAIVETPIQFQYGSDHTTTQWSSRAKERLADMCVMRILTAGDVETGKSSMVLSLLNNKAYLTEKADRTEVVDCWNWALPDGKVVAIYDLGGHPAYYYTCNYFHFDSKNNVILLCHSLMSETYSNTFQWVKAIFSRSPKSQIIPILTKVDQAKSIAELKQRKLQFITAFQELLHNEMSQIDEIVSRNTGATLPIYGSLYKKYSNLSISLSDFVFLISSAVVNDTGMILLNKHIIQMSGSSENTIKILQEFKEFYMENGVMGIDDEQVKGIDKSTDETTNISVKPKANPNFTYTVDPFTQALEKASGAQMAQQVGNKGLSTSTYTQQPAIPVRAKVVRLEHAKAVYDIIAKRNRVDKNGLRKCLLCLHSYGMLLWFEGNPQLEKIIFNDISFFKEILKAVFHHNALQFLQFQNVNSDLKHLFENKAYFDNQVKMLTSQGIMTKHILRVLLSKSNFSEAVFVMHLLEKLNVAYIMPTMKRNLEKLFIPYYVDQTSIPKHVRWLITDLAKCSTREMAVVFSVTGNFPSTFWHNLCVRLIKRLEVHAMIQERIVFVNGFWAKLDHNYIYARFENGKNVVITARCTVEYGDHIKSMWSHLIGINDSICDIINKWWPGIITNQVINCPHCLLQQRPSYQRSTWDFTTLLREPPNYSFHCGCEPDINLPAALIKPLSSDANMAKKQLSELKQFLLMSGTKKNMIEKTALDQAAKIIPKITDLSEKNLAVLAYHIRYHWKEVGEALYFSEEDFEKLETDNDSNLLNMINDMLLRWTKMQEPAEEKQILATMYSSFESCGFVVDKALGGQDPEDLRPVSAAPGPNVAQPRPAAKTPGTKPRAKKACKPTSKARTPAGTTTQTSPVRKPTQTVRKTKTLTRDVKTKKK